MAERWAFVFREGVHLDDREPIFGEQRAVVELARYVQQIRKANVSLLVNSESDALFGIPVVCDARPTDQIAWIQRQNPDVVVGVSSGRIFCRAQGRRNVVYHHNPSIVEGVEEFGRELYARIQKLIVVSHNARDRQLEWGAPARKLAVINNGIDHTVFYDRELDRNPRRFLMVGSIVDYKGIDVVLAAFNKIRASQAGAELHVYGQNGKYAASPLTASAGLDWMSQQGLLNQEGWVDWPEVERRFPGVVYKGCVDNDQLAKAYCSASLLLVGSRIPETFGLTSIEAQACGCVPIVPNHGGMPETVSADCTGKLYSPGDSEMLAQLVNQLMALEDTGNLQPWRTRAIEHAKKHYSWELTGDAFCRAIATTRPHSIGNAIAAMIYRWRRRAKSIMHSGK